MWEHSLLMEGSDTMGADMIYGRELHLSRKEADGCGHLLNISIFLSCGSHKFSMSKVEFIIFLPNFFLSLTSLAVQKAPTPLLAQYSWASLVAQLVRNLPAMWRPGFDPWVGKILWRWEWLPARVSLPREFHRQRSLADYSP